MGARGARGPQRGTARHSAARNTQKIAKVYPQLLPKPPKTEPKRCPGADFVALRNYVFYPGFGYVLEALGVPATNETPTKARGGFGTLKNNFFTGTALENGAHGSQMAPQGTSRGGSMKSLFHVFCRPGSKWCPRWLQGSPKDAQSHPKNQLLMIFGRVRVECVLIFDTF